jgi:hypothetical protein
MLGKSSCGDHNGARWAHRFGDPYGLGLRHKTAEEPASATDDDEGQHRPLPGFDSCGLVAVAQR